MHALLLAAVVGFTIPDSDLARQVVSERPELATVETDWERVNILREWAYCHTMTTAGQAIEASPVPDSWYTQSAAEFYHRFDNRDCGVWCQAYSIGLRALYKDFGYDSWVVCTGSRKPIDAVHAQTLVEIQHGGKPIIVLEDAQNNAVYTDKHGDPLDYFDMLKRLHLRKHDTIRFAEPNWKTLQSFPYRIVPSDIASTSNPIAFVNHYRGRACTFVVNSDGSILLRGAFAALDWLGQNQRYRDWLAANGYPDDLAYMHLCPHRTKTDDIAMRARIAAEIARQPEQQAQK